jgi:DNA-binding NtrC family response regulator
MEMPTSSKDDLHAFHNSKDEGTFRVSPRTFSPDGAVLIVLSGRAKGRTLPIPGSVGSQTRIGKAPDNDLVLEDETISRRHCALERVTEGLRVVDLGSTNGVRVGGARIKEALVEPGTVFRVGDVEVLVGVELADTAVPESAQDHFGLAVGCTPTMRRIFSVLERVAPTPASVLLMGETGTGKDVLARSIHMRSARADGPFEVFDCGAVSTSLVESELFGHERGAFTGAVSSRAGTFERAAGGTLFLDEIGELPLALQPKLLRVLEAREVRRVGGAKSIPVDVRIVAATTRNLLREVASGGFRDDLYFRLAVVTIDVPPLRQRVEDIPALVRRLLGTMSNDGASPIVRDDVVAALKSYAWPGNIRELRNVLERALHVARGNELRLEGFPPREAFEIDAHAPEAEPSGDAAPSAGTAFDGVSYRELRARVEAQFEREYVTWLLERHDGNVSAAARYASMDRNHLSDLARRHGIDRAGRGRPRS